MDAPPQLAVPSRARVVDQLVETLTDAIVSGRFAPGGRLPPERELADQLQVNRTSLRQALSRLEQSGLVESRQGSGTIVLDPVDNPDPHVMARVVHHAGPQLLQDLFEVRKEFVALAARSAAARATAEQVVQLRRALDDVAAARGAVAVQQAEMAWFVTLVECSGNRVLLTLIRWFALAYADVADSFAAAFGDPIPIHSALAVVVDTIERHDPEAAAAAMSDYAEAGAALLLAALPHGREVVPRAR